MFCTPTLHWRGFQTEASLSFSHLLTTNLFHPCNRVLRAGSPSAFSLSLSHSQATASACMLEHLVLRIRIAHLEDTVPSTRASGVSKPQTISITFRGNADFCSPSEIFPISLKTQTREGEPLISLLPRLLAPSEVHFLLPRTHLSGNEFLCG